MKMINDILEYLDLLYPDARCELLYDNDWELLLAIVLSAQATDKGVNKVTRKLFSKYKTLEELSMASISDIEDIIHEIGTFRRKSKYIKEIASKLVSDGYKGIPNDGKPLTVTTDTISKISAAVGLTDIELIEIVYYEWDRDYVYESHKKKPAENIISGLSDEERILIDLFRKLPEDQHQYFLLQLRAVAEAQE